MKANTFLRVILFVVVLVMIKSCAKAQHNIQFNSLKFIDKIDEYDSTVQFVRFCLNRDFRSCEKIYPDITKIDVSDYMSVGDYEYLLGVGDFIMPYIDKPNRLVAVAVYLRMRYLMREDSYGNLLGLSALLSKNSDLAIYLLAELRYKFQYDLDAKYLINLLYSRIPENKEVVQLFEEFKNIEGELANVDLKEFLNREVIYSIALMRE